MSARTLGIAILVCAAACSGDPNEPPEASYSIAIRDGSQQQGPAGSILPEPLQVTVTNIENQPVQGVVVVFRSLDQVGELTDSIGVTGLGGVAHTFVRLGGTAGPHRFVALLRRAPDKSVIFDVEATPPAIVSAVEPASFDAEDTVVVRGENFNTDPLGNAVYFGAHRGRVLSIDGSTSLRVVVPACVPPGNVAVRVEIGTAVTNSVQASYTSTAPVLSLAVGQGLVVDAAQLGQCLQLAAAGPQYRIVPQFAAAAPDPEVTSFQIGRVPAGTIITGGAPLPVATAWRSPQQRLDSVMRAIEQEIAPAAALQGGEPGFVPLEALTLNSLRSFRVISDLGDPGEPPAFTTATARLKFIGDHILIYVDERATSSLTEGDLAQVGRLFDERLYDIAVSTFGSESDLDANGKVIVLMTPSVNSLVTRAECADGGFIAGYFYPNDLFLRNQNSNKGEIFYTLVPDPTGTFSCTQSVNFVKRFIPTTFIHELQHMISFNQHVLARAGSSEDVWLNEGLSLVAEEMAAKFYEDRGDPVQSGWVFSDSASMFINDIVVNAYDYLASSRVHSITTFEAFGSLEERGGAWLFLRWLGDQKGDAIFGRLVQTRSTSVDNVQDKAGETFPALFGDFAIAVIGDIPAGTVRASLPPRYKFRRDFRAIFAAVSQRFSGRPSASPIRITVLPTDGNLVSSSMVQGTMDFFSLSTTTIVEPSTGLRFIGSVIPFSPTAGAQVGIVRVQ